MAEVKRKQLQTSIDAKKSMESRRRLGQFATPYKLAREIISYGLTLQDEKKLSFLEPSMGAGAFYSAFLSECANQCRQIQSAVGIELDRDFYDAACELWGGTGIKLINGDFTQMDPQGKVNFLIGNPPYVRHHYIAQEQKARLSAMIKNEMGISVSGLSGLYCYFVLCAHKWLAPNAVCGWLIPSEFMDVNYGGALKEYLLNDVRLLRIHRYDPGNCKFEDALVSSCVVWFRNEKVPGNYSIEFSYGGSHEQPEIREFIDKNTLLTRKKWTRLLEMENTHEGPDGFDSPTLGDFFTIKRGLATGDNDFFILSKEQIDAYDLDMKFFTPVLPSPRYLKCDEVFGDKNGYPCLDTQYFLLSCDLPEEVVRECYPSVWDYLDGGRDTTAQRYLCKSRKIWYCQENRAATPFLCSYMGRGKGEGAVPFRFILNHTKAIATNSYLMLYPKDFLSEAIADSSEALQEIWKALSNISASDLEKEGRVYGGGLKKIEPKELADVRCPQLAELLTYAS